MFQLIHNQTVHFNGSILGFEEFDEFSIEVVEEGSPYAYLQSMEHENIGFLVVNPFIFHPNYVFQIEDHEKSLLELQTPNEVVVLNTVTIREPFTKSTVNLLAPLVINITNGQARQIVLPPKSNYGTNEPLFKEASVESGE